MRSLVPESFPGGCSFGADIDRPVRLANISLSRII